jgi:hypothetical protein
LSAADLSQALSQRGADAVEAIVAANCLTAVELAFIMGP